MAYILLITGWAEHITECIYEHVLAVSIVMDCERNVLYLWGRAIEVHAVVSSPAGQLTSHTL